MSLFDTIKRLSSLLMDLTKDLTKVQKGNKSAAQRIRVRTVELTKVGKKFRQESVRAEKSPKWKRKKKRVS